METSFGAKIGPELGWGAGWLFHNIDRFSRVGGMVTSYPVFVELDRSLYVNYSEGRAYWG